MDPAASRASNLGFASKRTNVESGSRPVVAPGTKKAPTRRPELRTRRHQNFRVLTRFGSSLRRGSTGEAASRKRATNAYSGIPVRRRRSRPSPRSNGNPHIACPHRLRARLHVSSRRHLLRGDESGDRSLRDIGKRASGTFLFHQTAVPTFLPARPIEGSGPEESEFYGGRK